MRGTFTPFTTGPELRNLAEVTAEPASSLDFGNQVRETACGQFKSPDPGRMCPFLLVESADLYPLFVAEERHIDSTRQMILAEFERGPGVNDAVAVEEVRAEGYDFWQNKDSLSAGV